MSNTGRKNKVIIIGAGVAGLTAGSYLARKGFQVTVLEANPKIGGCCGATEIDGYTFNDGAQYLVYPKLLDLVFSQLGFDRSEILPLRRVATPGKIDFSNGISVSIGNRYALAVENGHIDIPVAQQELAQLVKKWAPLDDILTDGELMLNPFSALRLLSKTWKHLPKFTRTLKGELELNFSDPIFRSAVAAQLLYAGAPLDRLPAVSIIAFVNGLRDGMHLPIGGMGKIPDALAYTLQEHGGQIILNARVNNIRIWTGHVCGVETDGPGFVEADFVLSTVNGMATYQFLLDESDQPKRLVEKARMTPISMRAFCIQLGVSHRLNTESHIHHMVPMIGDLRHFIQPARDIPEWGYYSIPTIVAPELAPDGHSILEYVPAIRQDESTDAWDDERINDLANRCIDWLRSRHPMNIQVKRVRSPREFEKQLNLYHGSIYGVSATKGLTGLFAHKTPIKGLYLAGQTTYPGLGVPTAALSGIHASKTLMQELE